HALARRRDVLRGRVGLRRGRLRSGLRRLRRGLLVTAQDAQERRGHAARRRAAQPLLHAEHGGGRAETVVAVDLDAHAGLLVQERLHLANLLARVAEADLVLAGAQDAARGRAAADELPVPRLVHADCRVPVVRPCRVREARPGGVIAQTSVLGGGERRDVRGQVERIAPAMVRRAGLRGVWALLLFELDLCPVVAVPVLRLERLAE